jgi:putative ubiquitin-RnfH superfamily antitoxin RatB of RatAB toxin-antitoxin module
MTVVGTLHCVVARDEPGGPQLLELEVPLGSTVADVLVLARAHWGEGHGNWEQARVGIWGAECSRSQLLRAADRVEIYRELPNDPKTARRLRARRARHATSLRPQGR